MAFLPSACRRLHIICGCGWKSRAHYFLLWQDGLFFRNLGIELLDLMGYEPNTKDKDLKGVYTWKEGTHGQTEMLYHYYPSWFYVFRKLRKLVT